MSSLHKVEVKPDPSSGLDSGLCILWYQGEQIGQPCLQYQAAEICEWLNDGGWSALEKYFAERV